MPFVCKQTGYAFYTAFDCAKFLMMCSTENDHRLLDDYEKAVKNQETILGYSFDKISREQYATYKPSRFSCRSKQEVL